jgi:hypothetical protein
MVDACVSLFRDKDFSFKNQERHGAREQARETDQIPEISPS